MAKIPGIQLEAFKEALLNAYDTHESLAMMVRFRLNENLDAIAGGGNLEEIVFNLLTWAEAEGRFEELVRRAHQYRPDSEPLKQFAQPYLIGTEDTKLVEIPFVIVAMTDSEVDELIDGHIFDSPTVRPIERQWFDQLFEAFNLGRILDNFFDSLAIEPLERQQFGALVEALSAYRIVDVLQPYGNRRDEWRPPMTGGVTIQQTVEEVITITNKDRLREGRPELYPAFYSRGFFSEDDNSRLRIWDELRQSVCIFLIDAVSIFHPRLREKLIHSHLCSASHNHPIVVVSPIGADVLPIDRHLEAILRLEMAVAFGSYQRLELCSEFHVGNIYRIKRWLRMVLSETAEIAQGQIPHPESKQVMRLHHGEPTGIDRYIFERR